MRLSASTFLQDYIVFFNRVGLKKKKKKKKKKKRKQQ